MPQVVGGLEDPALGRLARLEGLQRETVLGVGGRHVGLFQPAGVGRHVGLGLESEGSHVVHEDRDALLGQGGTEGVHGLQWRVQLHQTVEVLGRPGDARILRCLLQRDGRNRMGRLPLQQRPGQRIESEQVGQHAGPRARQPDDDPRALDALLPHLGVILGPAVQRDAVRQRVASIFETRMRPNVVSSASSSQERRNTSSGSR